MRSGREHLAWILAVEVRQGTLGVDGRGWGPAGNTGRGWSWLRSGREHWAWMVVVEVRQRTLCVEGRGWAGGGEERRRGAGNWHKIWQPSPGRWGKKGTREQGEEQEGVAPVLTSRDPHLAGLLEKTLRHVVMLESTCHWFPICFQYIVYRLTAGNCHRIWRPSPDRNNWKRIQTHQWGTFLGQRWFRFQDV